MTKTQAIYQFFNQFLTAYPETAVTDDVTFPYLTYENHAGNWNDTVGITVKLWFYTTSESIPNAKAKEIADAISNGGTLISCDEGKIWIRRGNPWMQGFTDDTDPTIKGRYLQVLLNFLTID